LIQYGQGESSLLLPDVGSPQTCSPTLPETGIRLERFEDDFRDVSASYGRYFDLLNGLNEGLSVVKVEDEVISVGSLKRLRPSGWLNSDIINAYRRLLGKRSSGFHIFNTSFYSMTSEDKWNTCHLKVCIDHAIRFLLLLRLGTVYRESTWGCLRNF
jgi:hypothetical protein